MQVGAAQTMRLCQRAVSSRRGGGPSCQRLHFAEWVLRLRQRALSPHRGGERPLPQNSQGQPCDGFACASGR